MSKDDWRDVFGALFETLSEYRLEINLKRATRRSASKSDTLISVPKELDSDKFREAWAKWIQARGSQYAKPQRTAQLNRLAVWGPDRAAAAIEHSLAQGWKGIYEANGVHNGVDEQSLQKRAEEIEQ